MKKLDRVKAALKSEAVDRPPYGFWTHLPGIDLHPQRLAQETGGSKPILGGLQRAHITRRDWPGIEADIESAMAETGGRGILLGPACVIRHPVDDATLLWTAEHIKALAQ